MYYEGYLINIVVHGPENNGHCWIRNWICFVLSKHLHWFLSRTEIICERLMPENPKNTKKIVLKRYKNIFLFCRNIFLQM